MIRIDEDYLYSIDLDSEYEHLVQCDYRIEMRTFLMLPFKKQKRVITNYSSVALSLIRTVTSFRPISIPANEQ